MSLLVFTSVLQLHEKEKDIEEDISNRNYKNEWLTMEITGGDLIQGLWGHWQNDGNICPNRGVYLKIMSRKEAVWMLS